MKLFRGTSTRSTSAGVARADSGPVVVLVDDPRTDGDALEWAAAEAAARDSELRIVHPFRWPHVLDPTGNAAVDLLARGSAEDIVTEAANTARRVAPALRITTRVVPGRAAAALAGEAAGQGLVVIGHGRHRLERSLHRKLAHHPTASIAVVGLSGPAAPGPSTGRVVVAADENDAHPATLGFAFRAARRRRTGLTVVITATAGPVEDAVRIWRMAYPDIDVRWELSTGPAGAAVLAQSAALTVLGAERQGRRRRTVRGSAAYEVLRLARGPVVLVGTGPL